MLPTALITFSLLGATLPISDALRHVSITKKFHTISTKICAVTTDTAVASDVKVSDDLYDIESWRRGYKTCSDEIVSALDGNFPNDLEGTYFRNIFGKFESGKVPILHPFDADGMAVAVTMKVSNHLFGTSMHLTPCVTEI